MHTESRPKPRAFTWATLFLVATSQIAFAQATPKLRFVPVAPCRILDTRPGGLRLAANAENSFRALAPDLSAQGGSPTGCGLPPFDPTNPSVRAIAVNFVAISPTGGGGNLKAWAADQSEPATTVLNFQTLTPNLNIANQITLALRTTGLATDPDFKVKAARSIDLVGDVVGYYTTENYFSARSIGPQAVGIFPGLDFEIPLPNVDEASGLVSDGTGLIAPSGGRFAVHFGAQAGSGPPPPDPALILSLKVNLTTLTQTAVGLQTAATPTTVERSTIVTLQPGDRLVLVGRTVPSGLVVLDSSTTGTSAWMTVTQVD